MLPVLLALAAAADALQKTSAASDDARAERNDELTLATAITFIAFFGTLLLAAGAVAGALAAHRRLVPWLRHRRGET